MSAAVKYVHHAPASSGYGPAQAVVVAETGVVVGYVRRISFPSERGNNWQVYGPDGDEIAVADQRRTAANFLVRRADLRDP